MESTALRELYLEQLRDIYDAEEPNFEKFTAQAQPPIAKDLLRFDETQSVRTIWNHPNFANPSATFGSGFPLTSTPDSFNPYFGNGSPRNVQLVPELEF